MRTHVSHLAPAEACGLVAGQDGRAEGIIPVTNSLQSPVRFRMDPQEQLAAFEWIEQQGLELLAIYHSHPAGPATPSATDIAEWYYPETAALIWSPLGEEWSCRGFSLVGGQAREVEVVILAA